MLINLLFLLMSNFFSSVSMFCFGGGGSLPREGLVEIFSLCLFFLDLLVNETF